MTQNDQEKNQKSPVLAYAKGSQPDGFFTIRRRGQGKWTRLGTAIGSAIIIFGGALFIYSDVRATSGMGESTAMYLAAGFVLISSLIAFWLQNTANNVSFLIDTDSDMKKVNWTSRQELIGSTKVVILFMFILSTMLFFVDILFGYFFKLIGVLKISPFGN